MSKKVIFPGTFDPITLGHEEIVKRALTVFDEVVIAVAKSQRKQPSYALEFRQQLCKAVFADESRVQVLPMEGLLVDFLVDQQARFVLRGLRTGADFEYESQLCSAYQALNSDLEMIYFAASDQTRYISSTLVKEVMAMGGSVEAFMPESACLLLENQESCH